MAEPTLTLKLADFRNRVSHYLGKGIDYTVLDTGLKARIDFCIENGLRRFYYPQMDGGLYEWTFLHPKASLTLSAGDADYDLPENYGGGISEFSLAGDHKPIRVVPEPALRAAASRDATQGTPLYAAIRTKSGTTLTTSNRYEVVFYPTPNANLTAEYTYAVNPDKLTDLLPYPLGGAQHGQTILALCLAEAERLENDQAEGIHSAEAGILLKASIEQDKKLRAAQDALPWPVVGTPPTSLGLTYMELQRDVGHLLDIGANPDTWTHEQYERVDAIIQSGYRQFLVPPPVDIARGSHEWSFLKPVTTLATVASQGEYDLPAGFVGIENHITYPEDSGYPPIMLVGENEIRRFRTRAGGSNTGRPRLAAVRPKTPVHTSEPRWEVMFWPIPDAAYTLSYANITPSQRLSETNLHPLGGVLHAETIRESVLAMAERELGTSVHYEYFQERLRASIMADRRAMAGRLLGVLTDTAELEDYDFGRAASITYVGGPVNLNNRVSTLEAEQLESDAFLAQVWGGGPGVLQNNGNTFLKLTAFSPATMSAQVQPGLAFVADLSGVLKTIRKITATTLVTFVAPTANPRIDLVQIDSTGYINVKQGSEAGVPVAPIKDAGTEKLGEVYCRVGMTSIKETDDAVNGYITDGRSFV